MRTWECYCGTAEIYYEDDCPGCGWDGYGGEPKAKLHTSDAALRQLVEDLEWLCCECTTIYGGQERILESDIRTALRKVGPPYYTEET